MFRTLSLTPKILLACAALLAGIIPARLLGAELTGNWVTATGRSFNVSSAPAISGLTFQLEVDRCGIDSLSAGFGAIPIDASGRFPAATQELSDGSRGLTGSVTLEAGQFSPSGTSVMLTFSYQLRIQSGSCSATVSGASTTSASRTGPYSLRIETTGSGSGTVSSNPSGIDCGATCAARFAAGTEVTLTATPAAGHRVGAWGGACAATTGNTCELTVTADTNASVTFTTGQPSVTTTPGPNGRISPASLSVSPGAVATFSAIPDAGYRVDTIRGCDGHQAGTRYTTAAITADCSVTARFSAIDGDYPALRVATWNVETLGEIGEAQYQAARSVLQRLDADVVALQALNGGDDIRAVESLAADLGYDAVTVSPPGSFGGLRAALLSDFPIVGSQAWTAAELSGDAAANDLTRDPYAVTVDLPRTSNDLRLIIAHLKAGDADVDAFRRAVESYRLVQVTDASNPDTPFILLGDLSADMGDEPLTPDTFTALPAGLPDGFVLGSDLESRLAGTGLLNDPSMLLGTVSHILQARQLDGSDATRPASGRALDHLLLDPAIDRAAANAQVFDCADEGRLGGLPLAGQPLDATTCAAASSHLPVFADLTIAPEPAGPTRTGECLLDCAEQQFPALLVPKGSVTQYAGSEYYRYYRDSNSALRLADDSGAVAYVDPRGERQAMGTMADWLPLSGCMPPPTDCLFDWAEQAFPALFPPGTATTVIGFDETYRAYPQADSLLTLSSRDNHIWYRIGKAWADAGSYAYWTAYTGCESRKEVAADDVP